ncbi:MAG: AAA family ATPase [Armatimonadetes bacterium]|nr:AAA family ATPase [Armatimonadota bacterium]
MAVIRLADLPLELTTAQAVEAAHARDLDWIVGRLRSRLSVLVECDKAVTPQLFIAVRDRLKLDGEGGLTCHLVRGQPRRKPRAARADLPPGQRPAAGEAPDEPERALRDESDQGYLRTFLSNLRAALEEGVGRDDVVVVLPHLDLLTTTTQSGLTDLAKETLAWIHECPDALLLGFKDPSLELPRAVEDVFTVKYPIIGLRREVIGKLLLRREARKFCDGELNPYRFFKYVSGLNVLRFRRLMRHFDTAPDYDPARPETADRLYRTLREMTLLSDFEVPQVDLHRDIGGYETVKRQLEEDILQLLQRRDAARDEDEARRIEELIPKGLIFHGPPGTGKTFFAKAMATALDATIIIVSGPELKERWVGASEENLRRVFARARKSAPSIIVFDELDSIAARRGMYYGSGVEHSMVNQLLTEMDGFRGDELVFVVGTTNFAASLDPALLRPGRFEMQIELPYPDEADRRAILELYRERFELDLPDAVVEYAVERTEEFADYDTQQRYTGDHLAQLCRALKRRELREGRFTVSRRHIDEALQRPRHGSVVVTEEELHTVACHEVGHAVCAQYLPHCPNVRKISLLPGEMNLPALGVMIQQARENRNVITREEFVDHIAMSLGGRLAEELMLGKVSSGAQNDLLQATHLARVMTEELGMGEQAGNRAFRVPTADGPKRFEVSESTAEVLDGDVNAILQAASERARDVLRKRRTLMERLTKLLLEHRVLEDEELEEVWEAP